MYKEKNIIVFDLDNTLSESTCPIDNEMSELFPKLLEVKKVAIISGSNFSQIKREVLERLPSQEKMLENLYIFPTCSTQFYRFDKEWKKVYAENLTEEDIEKIVSSIKKALEDYGFKENELYGEIIENRQSQVTFSGLGNKAPLEKKSLWDPNQEKRRKIVEILKGYIPEFDSKIGGTSSIDITKKGIDKAYGIRKIEKTLNIPIENMLFIGDALFPGGNDYPVKETGVECIQVANPEETKAIILKIIS